MKDGRKVVAAVVTFRDATPLYDAQEARQRLAAERAARRAAEEERTMLARAREELLAAVEQAPAAICLMEGPPLVIRHANAQYRRIAGA